MLEDSMVFQGSSQFLIDTIDSENSKRSLCIFVWLIKYAERIHKDDYTANTQPDLYQNLFSTCKFLIIHLELAS